MGERPGPMEKEPEDMSIGIVRFVSSIFSGFLGGNLLGRDGCCWSNGERGGQPCRP
jgi:hypothetical protein